MLSYLRLVLQQLGHVNTAGEHEDGEAGEPGDSVRKLVLRSEMEVILSFRFRKI